MVDIFTNAINRVLSSKELFLTPQPFQEYLNEIGIKHKSTVAFISVQTFKDLNKQLKEAGFMVFRLGSPVGQRKTSFTLVDVKSRWADFFFFDDDIFKSKRETELSIDWSADQLLPFRLIPKLTETSHVNLAIELGVLEATLGFDTGMISVPATGRGNYSFSFKPYANWEKSFSHEAGQVEIDSVIVAKRNGKKHILVVEAKSGAFPSSLAKHKLAYPVFSILPSVPGEYEIIPIYMRIEESEDFFTFYVAECFSISRGDELAINKLEIKTSSIIKARKH